jgi:tetratricopeptide (TPR) repeat protein
MRWLQAEYVLKGIYLGLLVFVAVEAPGRPAIETVSLCTLGGLALALVVAAVLKFRQGYRPQGRPVAFVVFLLLESPTLVYAGILLGMTVGAYLALPDTPPSYAADAAAAGAVLGIVFSIVRQQQQRAVRLGLSLLLGVALMAGLLWSFNEITGLPPTWPILPKAVDPVTGEPTFTYFAWMLLLGMPLFYLLTFAGQEEETEVEIGVVCAALGLAGYVLLRGAAGYQSLAFLLPIVLYAFYTMRVLPGLRVFKHTLRGFSYARVRRYRQALQALRRALQLDPRNKLAREAVWSIHRSMDLSQLVQDPETLALIDLDLCQERASALLMQPGPSPARLEEALRLLDLILHQQPAARPRVLYWRTVARTHGRQFDQAAADLEEILDGSHWAPGDPERRAILLPAWQLALTLHEELRRRVGVPQLAQPGRRMEAIAAVERHLADSADDEAVWGMKRQLYQDLTEADYGAAAGPAGAAADFDHGYAQQLGLALIGDPVRWPRGAEYLRMAARGLPNQAPTLLLPVAQAHQKAGDPEGAWRHYELVKQAGQAAGPKNLAAEDRQAYFATVKLLAEAAQERGDLDAAVENYHLYTESERSGIETLRRLADLYERRGDPLSALRVTEQALLYNGKDKELLERKDKYYYSVMPEDLQARLESFTKAFDVAYCLRKAKALLDARGGDLDVVDWAQHLAKLATVVKPESVAAQVLLAQAQLRRGERDEAVALLESLHSGKPEQFATSEDEDAWYRGCQILGRLYLDELGRPDLAVPCFLDFRKSSKSGADTLYRLGQCYEQLGDRPRAKKCYEHVTAYDNHPLAPEARDALYRLQSN